MFYIVDYKIMNVNPNSLFYRKTFHGFLIFFINVSQTDILVYSKALPAYFWHKKTLENQGL